MRLKTTALVLGLTAAIACALWLSGNPTFRLFFAWPNGGTWSNTIAWLEDAFFGALFMFIFRDRVGKRLAAWWHRHTTPHLEAKLAEHRDEIQAQLDDHKAHIERVVREGNGSSGNRSRSLGE